MELPSAISGGTVTRPLGVASGHPAKQARPPWAASFSTMFFHCLQTLGHSAAGAAPSSATRSPGSDPAI